MIGGGFRGIPDVVKNLLIINALAFVALYFMRMQDVDLNSIAGMFYPKSNEFRPFQLVTHMFMHGSLFHIFFNMFALWMLGSPLESVWGPKRFLTYFLITGFGAAALHLGVIHFQVMQVTGQMDLGNIQLVYEEGRQVLLDGKNYIDPAMAKLNLLVNIPTVGASGAVFGILLGFGMLFPNTKLYLMFLPIPIKAKYFVMGYALIELYLGFANRPGDNIAHFAHLGGMLFGFILIRLWQKDRGNFY